MVLLISGVVLALGVLLLAMGDETLGGAFIMISLLVGFLLCGMLITAKTEEVAVPAKIYCSTEVGECRVITDESSFTVDSYFQVQHLLTNPDSVTVEISKNSYGLIIKETLILK